MAVAPAPVMDPGHALLARLNPAQREAVTCQAPALLVYAGAGTGKTRVLTHRIAHLIAADGVPPRAVLATTFTRKAAAELRARLARMVPGDGQAVTAGTFNSIGYGFLRHFRHLSPYGPQLEVCDPGAQLGLLGQIRKELGLRAEDYPAELLRALIGRLKADGLTLERYVAFCKTTKGSDEDPHLLEVYRRYQGALRRRSQVDFDDQVLETTMLFVREPGALQAVRRQFRYLFVDEFQDINRAQWELVQVLAGDPMADDRTYLCCVGDDDQSIYGFRGAHPDFVGEFSRRYEPRTVVLEDNYRSGRPILEVANRLLREKSWGATKTLRPTAPGDFKPRVLLGLDPDDEAAQVAAEIGKLAAAGVPLREIAVLYRQNAQSRPFEEVLLRRQVEHVVVGGLGFYQRPEVQQALAFLRLAWDDHDHEALTQAAQVTLRYLKRDLRHEFLHAVEQQGIGVLELPKHLGSLPELPPYGTRAARELAELIKELQGMRRRQPLPVLLDEALAKGGLRKVLESGTRQEDEDKLENLDELRAALASFNAQHPGAGIAEFLGEVQGKAGKPRRDDEAVEGVRLMTLHKAKGLEFRAVFLAGLEEKRLPHARSIEEGNLAEELRLLYVGVTRAKERLYLSAAEVRYAGPNDAPRPVLPSRFLQQLAPELLEGEKDAVEHLLGLRTRATAKDRMVAKAVAQSKPSPKPPTTKGAAKSKACAAAPKPPKRSSQPPAAKPSAFTVGQPVRHGAWGPGTIAAIQPAPGGDHHLTIWFADGSKRTVSERVAPLEGMSTPGGTSTAEGAA